MASTVAKNRSHAFQAQAHRCYYCGYQMWLSSPDDFARSLGITIRQAHSLRCTAEHLQAQCDGGTNRRENIAAACATCNRRRHTRKLPRAPFEFKALVTRRLKAGRWHSFKPNASQ
ncbi:MAG: HNH endonuclease [Pseudomonas sp.]|uniref:HNH endonuclease n=1 Tax=Pseudomonas sp. TaxID=306 RepID=UPI003D6ECEE8